MDTQKTFLQEEYVIKLRDPRWALRRIEILERDGNCCRLCQSIRHLNVHHREYIWGQEPWDYPDDLLITLCEKCHGKQHKNILSEKNFLLTLRLAGFSDFDIKWLQLTFEGFVKEPLFVHFLSCYANHSDLREKIKDTFEKWRVEKNDQIANDPNATEFQKLIGV